MSKQYIKLGIPLLDELLPKGILRKSLVIIAGEGGAGKSYIVQSIATNFLNNGEKVVYIAMDDDLSTIIEAFKTTWKIDTDKAIQEKRLLLVDGYGPRLGLEKDPRAVEALTTLEYDYAISVMTRLIDNYVEYDEGLLVIDSLNPFFLSLEPTVVYDFYRLVDSIRANISKKRGILTIATIHTAHEVAEQVATMIEHTADVFIITRYHEEAIEAGYAVKQILIKKAKGVPIKYGWINYVITDEGLVQAEVKVKEEDKK